MTTVTTSTVNVNNITAPRVPFLDDRTGLISREWFQWFLNMFARVNQGDEVAQAVAALATAPVVPAPEYQSSQSLDYVGPAPFVPSTPQLMTTMFTSIATVNQQLTNVAAVVNFDTDGADNIGNITRVGNTFEVNVAGYYVWIFTARLHQDKNLNITKLWLDLNGAAVADSTVVYEAPALGNTSSIPIVLAGRFDIGDVVTLYALTNIVVGTTLQVFAAAAPAPAAPAIQVVITGYQL